MIAVTGGTGFVGRHLIARLLVQGEQVRTLARHPAGIEGAEVLQGDVTDPTSLAAVFDGCDSAIHLVGVIQEVGDQTFRAVHVEGTRNVITACEAARATRLLSLSALGSRPDARSQYHRSKWEAEKIVNESALDTTIFRPSVMYGHGGGFLPRLRQLVQNFPVLPIMGDGTSLTQPIWVEDVVSCLLGALRQQETVGKTYELGGPETYGFEQLLDLIAEDEGLDPPRIHLPVSLVQPVVSALSRVTRRFPITPDQLTMLLEDNVCDISEMRRAFGVEPASLQEHLAD
jgi:uncharacterized protein YbjT (DUF2867 family)